MGNISNYIDFIKESFDDDGWYSFEVGDTVIVNGIVDDRGFKNVKARILGKYLYGEDTTNMGANGEVKAYHYYGTTYSIQPFGDTSWWCPKYNLKPEIEPDPEGPVRVRWYNKGKLEEGFDYKFKEGDIVIVNGTVDDRKFKNVKAKVINASSGYQIEPLDGSGSWYVGRSNMKLAEEMMPEKKVV